MKKKKKEKCPVTFLGQDSFCMSQNHSEVLVKIWNSLSVGIVAFHRGFFNTPDQKKKKKKRWYFTSSLSNLLPITLALPGSYSNFWNLWVWTLVWSWLWFCVYLLATITLCPESLSILAESESREFLFSIWDSFPESSLCGFLGT